MRPKVEVQYPNGQVELIRLTRERTVVGRNPRADIQIRDKRVSREHCALEVQGEQIFVTDLGGSNGTWIDSTKLLANIREPFPKESVVYVGPAEIRNMTDEPEFDPEHDLESRVATRAVPERPKGDPGAQRVDAVRQVGRSAALLESSKRRIPVNPGERASMQLEITNQSKIVDHYTLSVTGCPKTWVTLPRSGVELLPRQSGSLNLDFHPPRHPRTSAGIHPISIALINQQGKLVTEIAAELEIGAFDDMELKVRPDPLQSRSGGTMTLTVENHGNAETEYRVDVVEASDSLDLSVEPTTSSVSPQQSHENLIYIRPRKRIWIGSAQRYNLTATVTSSRQSATVMPVYIQLATFPRWLPVLLLLCCCILGPLFAIMLWPEVEPVAFPTDTPTHTPTPVNTPTITPDIPGTQTATREIWCGLDDDLDGLLNCEELNVHQTLPGSKDTDGDGLTDFDELKKHGTDPTNRDTDGDTVADGEEVNGGRCLSPIQPDTDLDGLRDDIDPDSCTSPPTPTPTLTPVPDFGLGGQVNNSLDNAQTMQDARMDWVKIQLRFGLGADATSTIQDATQFKEKGFKLLLSVVGNKEELERGGVSYMQAFADFLGQISPVADGIEVWNEPNIQNEWPVGQINPGDYTEMLRRSYTAIKASNPRTIVISAAPAPTGANNETVMSDDKFIKGMAAAGAKNYMDCVGVHYNAGATPPSATEGHPSDSTGHYSYYFLPMLDLYYDTFNETESASGIPLCFTEIGYLTDDGFDQTLAQVGANNFLWAEGTTVFDQAEWLEEAVLRSCRSGKVQLFIVWNVDFMQYGQDPQAGYAILRPNGRCTSCETLARAVGVLRREGCMD